MATLSAYIRQLLGAAAADPRRRQAAHTAYHRRRWLAHHTPFRTVAVYDAKELGDLHRSIDQVQARRIRRLTGGNRTRHALSHSNLPEYQYSPR